MTRVRVVEAVTVVLLSQVTRADAVTCTTELVLATVFGSLLAILLIILLAYCCRNRCLRKRHHHPGTVGYLETFIELNLLRLNIYPQY